MNIDNVKTPEDLMKFLDENIHYGIIDKNGNKLYDSSKQEFQDACNNWRVRPVIQILKDGIAHCYDQVEIERYWFEKKGFSVKTFWISAYQEDISNSGFAHTYLIYKENENWKLFEHSDYKNKGIYEFKSIDNAIEWQKFKQIEYAKSCIKPIKEYSTEIYEYKKPKVGLNMNEFLDYVTSGKKID